MRHALIRFLTALDVDAAWYVTFPNSYRILPYVPSPTRADPGPFPPFL